MVHALAEREQRFGLQVMCEAGGLSNACKCLRQWCGRVPWAAPNRTTA
ncbi:MAG: hypothetical protein ACK40J_06990 [Rhodococcus sp. (in: high G+C Gram-positive bacteria)]